MTAQTPNETITTAEEQRTYELIPVSRIVPNPQQPRRHFDETALRELADSIAEHGLLQPIEVEVAPGGRFVLHHGERRWRACRLLQRETIPAFVVEAQDEETRLVRALVENIQREDMNVIEMGQAFRELRDRGMTLTAIARATGKTHAVVKNCLEWLDVEPEVQDLVASGELPRDHRVRDAVMSVPGDVRVQFARRCRNLNIAGVQRAAEVLANSLSKAEPPASKNGAKRPYDCPPNPGRVRRAHALTLVVQNCPVPGPYGEVLEKIAQATCKACSLFDTRPDNICAECPATQIVRGFVEHAEQEGHRVC